MLLLNKLKLIIMVTDLEVAKKFIQLRQSARDRGKDFDMSLKKIKQLLLRKTCYFTGVRFSNELSDPNQRSMDRLDNTKGYSDNNVVACTTKINSIKGDITPGELKCLYEGLRKAKLL